MALKPPPGHEKAKPIVMLPNSGKGGGWSITSKGEGNTIPEGYDRTVNMTCVDGTRLTPSFAAYSNFRIATPVAPSYIQPWIDAAGLPFNIILAGNNAILHRDNSIAIETDATPSVAISAVADSSGIPSYTHTSSASIQTGDVVNIDSSTQPTFAYTSVANNGGFVQYTTATNYLATGDKVDIIAGTGVDHSGTSLSVTVNSATTFTTTQAWGAGASTGTVQMTTKNYNGLSITVTRISDTVFTGTGQTFYGTATANVQREAQYTNACLFDDGGGAAAVPYLYAGTRTGRKMLTRRSRTGTWSEPTFAGWNSTNQGAVFVTAAGGRLWKTIDDYRINSFSVGTDPFSGTAATAVYVSTGYAKINALSNIEGRPIVGKEDAIYAYNSSTTQFDVLFKDHAQDPLNFTFFSSDGAGGLYTATSDGVLVHIERFGTITTDRPFMSVPGRDTPRGRITGVSTQGKKIALLLDRGGKMCQPPGMCVLLTTDSEATITDYTPSMVNQVFSTNLLDISGLSTIANGSWILVGADDKFAMLDFVMSTFATSRSNIAIQICNVSGGVTNSLGTDTATTLFNGTDSAPLTSSIPFGQSGPLVISQSTIRLAVWTAASGYLTADILHTYNNKFWLRVGVV